MTFEENKQVSKEKMDIEMGQLEVEKIPTKDGGFTTTMVDASTDDLACDEEEYVAYNDGVLEAKSKPWTFKRIGLIILDCWGTILFFLFWSLLFLIGGILLWNDLSWQAWFSMVVIFSCVTVLVKDVCPPHFMIVVAMSILLAAKIVTTKEALEGFSDSGMITIVVLFPFAKAIEVNKAADLLVRYIMRTPTKLWDAQLRLCIPNAFFSAFLNNTPQVAMMIPAIEVWSRRIGISASKFMLPLSFANVMGGVTSIIGTSPNLLVASLAEKKDPNINIGFFEVGIVGLPICIIGIAYMTIACYWLLPDRLNVGDTIIKNAREYTLCIEVKKGAPSVGKTLDEAGLRHIKGAFLYRIEREKDFISVPPPTTKIRAGDFLYFAGVVEVMKELLTFDGFIPATGQLHKVSGKMKNRGIAEVVIALNSPLIGKSVKETKFRQRYNAAIIGVHRRGERVEGNLGDIVFQAGDTLLVEAGNTFFKYHKNDQDFALVNKISETNLRNDVPIWKTIYVIIVVTVVIGISTAEVVNLLTMALLADCLFIFTGVLTINQAMESMQGDLIILIGAVFPLGTALEKTGGAAALSETFFGFLEPGGPYAIIFGIYLLTVLLTAVFTNNGTVALMYPLAYQYVQKGILSHRAVIFTIMCSASCSFLSPIGYQTDLMVMGPGGYTWGDYMKFGIPLTILTMMVATVVIYLVWG